MRNQKSNKNVNTQKSKNTILSEIKKITFIIIVIIVVIIISYIGKWVNGIYEKSIKEKNTETVEIYDNK